MLGVKNLEFGTDFCVTAPKKSSTAHPFLFPTTFGFCIPKSCTGNTINQLINNFNQAVKNVETVAHKISLPSWKFLDEWNQEKFVDDTDAIRCLQRKSNQNRFQKPYSDSTWVAATSVIIIFGLLNLIGSVGDFIYSK